ncbi:MAG: tetratricopeptide repeat protein [Myxococcota bacterium]|nr:tetratricopeptide repeat protein [Myxococcota bacterium]
MAAVASGASDATVTEHLGSCDACARVVEAVCGEDSGEPAPAIVGDPEPGDTVGRYVVIARLGAGGMGVVSSAYDPTLDRTIALKSIRADRASPALARRLEREAQSLAKLTHPHLVRVFDAGLDRGRLYIAMELVEGTTLDRWLTAAPRHTAEIVRVFREVAEALVAVHSAGFVHRDVKPDNILIDERGSARLADFGLVSTGSTAEGGGEITSETMTDPFTAVGTPAYMSPEQRRGIEVDARTDQYSWGVSLQHALNDREEPTLARIVKRASHEDPAARYPNMQDIGKALAPQPQLVWPLAGAMAGLLVFAAVMAETRYKADRCDVVDPFADFTARQPAIARAFEASGHVSWAARLEATTRASRATLTALADTSVATCRAARAADRSDEQERACLDDDRETARALFDELAHADRAMVDQASLAATQLARGASCRDAATRDIDRAPAKELAAELRRVKAKSAVRPPKDVIDEAKAIAQRATDAGAAQLEGEAKLLLGELQSRLRQDDVARVTLDEAARAAARSHDDRVAALARLLQAGQAALLTGAPERAAALGEVAIAAVERAGNPAELRGQLENVLGGIAFSRGKFGDAEAHYRASLAARTEAFGAEDHRIAQAHHNIGIALARQGRAADARKSHETALAINERVLGTDHPDLSGALSSLGTLAADEKRYADAAALFERTRKLRIAAFGPDHPDVGISENNLGKLANLQGQHREAIAHYERSLAIAEAKLGKDALEVALPLSGLAAVHSDLEAWTVARPLIERAIAVAEAKRGADHPALISMLITYSNVRAHTGEPDARRATLERAYAIAKSKLGVEHAQTVSLAKMLEKS